MKLTLLISCIIASSFFEICSGVKENDKLDYRLNTDIEPIDYVIDVTPYFDSNVPGKKQWTFDGACTITFKTTKANVSAITLHKSNLNITVQSVTQANTSSLTLVPQNVENIEISSSDYNKKTSKYTLKLASSLIPNIEYILKFEYIGELYADGVGFYRSSYQEGNVTKWFAATQLQATLARYMFPCFDEPRFKATFSTIVNRPAHFKPSLSNTPMVSSHSISPNLVREYFDKTPKMSTYLVAILVSEYECHENAAKNFSVCVRPEKSNQTEYVLDFGQQMVRTFDELFDYKYSEHISKLTLATSAFGTGGMENWGLILCGEGSLVYDPSKPRTLLEEKEMVTLVAHEIAHLWFGDLVTCDWWSHIWLNEGMAIYFQWFGVAELKRTWGMDHEFLILHFYDVLEDDSSLKTSEALSADVNTPAELSERFGDFIYNKGASIIRMMNYTLGNDKFIAAMRYYLKQNALKTVTPEHLFAALQTQVDTDFNFTEVFNGWVYQKGHPIISVRVSNDRKLVEIRQNRFLRNDTVHHDQTQWVVPLNWASNKQNSDFTDATPMAILRNSSMKIELEEPIDWIVFNVQQAGFYRVNYDDETWSAIARILQKSPSSVHVFNRAQLINDAFELARYSYSNYDVAIDIAAYLQDEIEYAPWSIAFKYFERILPRFKPNELHIFEKFGLKLLNRVYQHVGFHQKPRHSALDIRNRFNVIKYACKFGNKQCVADARAEYDRYLKGNYIIDADLASIVYCSVIEHGSEAEWDSIWNIVKSTDPGFEDIDALIKYIKLFDGLSCTKRANIVKKFLDLTLATDGFPYKSFALQSILTNRRNLHIVMDFVFAKHTEIKGLPVDTILSSIIDVVSTQEEIDRLESFIKENGMESNEELTEKMKLAKSNLRWADKYVPIIKNAIKRNGQKG